MRGLARCRLPRLRPIEPRCADLPGHLRPAAQPISAVTTQAHWAERVRLAWPQAPNWFVAQSASVLRNPALDSDVLLIWADALEQARQEARIEGQLFTACGLGAVSDLVRNLAPHRIRD